MSGPHKPGITVELLYFVGCPSYQKVWRDVADVLAETNLNANVRLVNVDSVALADALHFAGSPSVKVNGQDLEGYEGRGVMACRLYRENGGKGWPSRDLLKRNLLGQANGKGRGRQA
ncbi:MAG TPA: hypothetical protein VF171_02140 [Trueperaceae bacterium]